MKTSQEKKNEMLAKTTGKGLFLYRNHTNSDIMLPKMSNDGKQIIPPSGCFRGDDYFMNNMRGSLTIVEDLSNHGKKPEQMLVEVPPAFNVQGEVKLVTKEATAENQDVLLLEQPCDSVTILD